MANDESASTEPEHRLGQVLGAYYEAEKAGRPPSRDELLALHPDLAKNLADYFAEEEKFHRLTEPLRKRPSALPADRAGADAHDPFVAEFEEVTAGASGRAFGDYELIERIGQGRMGVVFKARQISLNRPVAVKMVRADRHATDDEVKRFRNEAEAVAELDHPQIVPIYEVGKHEGRDYFAMKLIEGMSLAGCLGRFPSDPKRAARIMAMVARAIHHAHQRAILHRDLKPSNILIDDAGQPYVSDFGLAKRLKGAADLTQSKDTPGTPRYMAPEQASGEKDAVTTATDIHALGVILYEMLTGRAAFQGDSVPEVLDQVKNREPAPPRNENRRVDHDLQTICLKCLEKEPNLRYGSALALAEDLERWERGEPIKARPVGPVVKGWRWARRNKFVASLLGIVGAMIIAGITGLSIGNAILVRKNAEIRRQRDIARTQRGMTRRALDEFFTRFVEQWLRFQPGTEKAQREFLERALEYDEEIIRGDESDPTAREEIARASLRVGKIRALLNATDPAERAFQRALTISEALIATDPRASSINSIRLDAYVNLANVLATTNSNEQAEKLYQHGIAICQDLLAGSPHDEELRLLLGRLDYGYATLLLGIGRSADSEPLFRQAIDLQEQLVSAAPTLPGRREELARSQTNLGLLFYKNSRRGDAEKAYREALAIDEKLARDFPAEPSYREGEARIRHNLAMILHESQRIEEAESMYRGAAALRERLAADFPSTPRYSQGLSRNLAGLASVLRSTGRLPEAERTLRRAVSIAEKLAAEHPGIPDYSKDAADFLNNLGNLLAQTRRPEQAEQVLRQVLTHRMNLMDQYASDLPEYRSRTAVALHDLAVLLCHQGKYDEARSLAQQAITHHQAALKSSPRDPTYLDRLRGDYVLLAETLLSLGDSAKASEAAEAAIRVLRDSWESFYNVASAYARCVPRLEKLRKLDEARRRKLVLSFADRAVGLLRTAIRKGYVATAKLFQDHSDFQSLRPFESFQRLIQELDGK